MSDQTAARAGGGVIPPLEEGSAPAGRNPARGMLLLTITAGVYIASGYAITVWLAHHLGPDDFGRYSVVAALVTLVNIAVARGVPVAATRAIAADPEASNQTLRAAARVTVPVALAAGAVAAAVAVPLAAALGDERLRVPLFLGAAAAFTAGMQAVPLAWFTGMHRYGRQALAQSWYAVSRLATIIAGGLLGGLLGAVAGFVVAPAVAALATLHGLGAPRTGAPHRSPLATERTLLRAAVPLVAVAALAAALLTVDLLAFKRVATAADAGRYAAAAAIAHVPFFLLRSVPLVLMPAVAAALAGARDARAISGPVRDEIRRGVGDAVVLLALPTALLVAVGDRALELVFGESYAVDELVVAPLALATAAITLYTVLVAVETALRTLRVAVAIGAVGLALVAAGAAVGGQGSNASRAAWGVAAAATLTFVVHAASMWARTGSFVPGRALAAVAVAGIVGTATLATPSGAWWLATSVVAASAAYGAIALRAGLVRLR